MGQKVTFRVEDLNATPEIGVTIRANEPAPPVPTPTAPLPGVSFQVGPHQVREGPPAAGPLRPVTFSAEDLAQPSVTPAPADVKKPATGLAGFLGEATQGFNPANINHAIQSAFWHPIQTATGMLSAGDKIRQEGLSAFEKGDYVTGTRKMIDWLLSPVGGGRLDEASDLMQQGQYARGLGAATDVGLSVAAPKIVEAVKKIPLAPATGPAREAVEFGLREGVPVDVATATGNKLLRGAQFGAEESLLGGTLVSPGARAAQAEGLTAVGQRLAGRTSGAAMTAEGAGTNVRTRVTQAAADYATAADQVYDRLRALEARQGRQIQQTGGIRAPATSAQPFTDIPLAVDIAPTKAAMRPIYDQLLRESELVPLMGDKARALTALDRLMQAPDMAPLSIADAALSDLKNLSRVDQTFRRTAGQGIAAQTVAHLDSAVQTSARLGGKDVFNALMEGRAATVNKFKTIAVLDTLAKEPVGIFNQAAWRADSGIEKLRAVARLAPAEVRQLGRAWLDDALGTATREGGFRHADALYNDWQNLGPETKKLMFGDAAHVKDLDNFFLLAKKMAENPNKSGSGLIALKGAEAAGLARDVFAMSPGLGTAVTLTAPILAKALLSPTTTRLLLEGFRIPVSSNAARVAWVGQMGRALRALEESSPGLVPAPAGAEERPTAPAYGRGAPPPTAGRRP